MRSISIRHLHLFLIAVVLVAALGVASPASPARAAMLITVDTLADNSTDDGLCTLREAITAANTNAPVNGADDCNHDGSGGLDTINFTPGLSGGTITLASQLTLASDLTIDGSALGSQISISGGGSVRVFQVSAGAITLKNLKVINGNASGAYGGGLEAQVGSSLTIENSVVSGNTADWGGGIFSYIPTTIDNSTFVGNTSTSGGAGLYFAECSGNSIITNTTITGNTDSAGGADTWYGGALQNSYCPLTIVNSTIAGNTSGIFLYDATLDFYNTIIAYSNPRADCTLESGSVIGDNIKNLIEDGTCSPAYSGDPLLGPLANNGGPTQTMELLPGSPAINTGDSDACPVKDQRDLYRWLPCDIGAFEAMIQLSSYSLAFGNQLVGMTSAPQTITVTNIGGETLTMGTLSVSSEFGLSANTCDNAVLLPSQTCSFNVTFTPLSTGPKAGTVTVPSDTPTGPETVTLSGNGVSIPAGTNLLLNPGFDSFGSAPKAWNYSVLNVPLSSLADCTTFLSPACALKLTASNTTKIVTQTVSYNGTGGQGFIYGLSSSALNVATPGTYKVEIALFDRFSRVMFTQFQNFTNGTHAWETKSGTFTAPANFTKMRFRFYFQKSVGAAWFDDAFLMLWP